MAKGKFILAALLGAAAAEASAQNYRCTGKDGKKYYSSTIPQACIGQPIEQLSPQGTVIRRFGGQTTEEDRAAKEAGAAKKREEDALAREERRRNQALLATYTSEKDIEDARARALVENDKAIKQVEARIAEVRKRQAGYDKEMEFYQEAPKAADKGGKAKPADAKGKSGAKPPQKLLDDIRNAEVDLKAQENLLATKKKEVQDVNAKYDEDKKHYLELTRPSKK
jgi:hypothetical protein